MHAVLERVDPADRDLPGALSRELAGQAARFPLAGLDTVALTDGLVQTLTTPLGALTDGRSLRELGAQNRLAELDFELPLGAADRRRRVADLAALFETHLSGTDPLHRYGAQLASSAAAESVLAGFLTGSIDVVLRVPGTQPRFVVLDYKTNRVPTAADEQLTARHSHPPLCRARCVRLTIRCIRCSTALPCTAIWLGDCQAMCQTGTWAGWVTSSSAA